MKGKYGGGGEGRRAKEGGQRRSRRREGKGKNGLKVRGYVEVEEGERD